MSADPKNERPPKPYHGMSWSVRLLVYFCCGIVLMAMVAALQWKGKSGDWWWVLWIPPATGVLGVVFPQAVDWLFARLDKLLHMRR
jgi:hypothetical protein